MRVLIVAEGNHELAGALEALIRRLTPGVEFEFDSDRVSRNDIHAFHSKGREYFKRSVRWLREAKKRGYEALVLVIDEDGRPERSLGLSEAQKDNTVTSIPRALGVAIRTFDAWMLADEKALTQVLESPTQRQPEPETIPDPKEVCTALLAGSGSHLKQREMYAAVASAANLDTLEERCPGGFRPFALRVRAL